jgi:hypothetical protein
MVAGGAVNAKPFGALAPREHEGGMIHLPAAAQEGVEVGDDFPMGEEIPKGLAVRFVPGEHSCEHPATYGAVKIPVRVMVRVVDATIPVGIEGFVERLYFGLGEKIGDLEVAVEVEKEKLAFRDHFQ